MLRDKYILKPFFRIRDSIMNKFDLFTIKSRIKRHIRFKCLKRKDEEKRKLVARAIMCIPKDWLRGNGRADIIISLTTHGKRLEKAAPYAIYSILQQKIVPKRIILNLDKNSWSDETLPPLLKKLRQIGVEVRFVEDIGPYTKFLPTLKEFPNDVIITVDDDIYYDSNMVEELLSAYEHSDKKSIICRNGMRLHKKDGKFITYSEQSHISACDDVPGVPFGVSGVLYPPHIFDDEIFNSNVYKKICPFTDDLWFGVMALRGHINVLYVHDNTWAEARVVDNNDEFNPALSTAMHFSNDAKANEIFNSLVDYYHLEN